MKTLPKCKDEVAQKDGWNDWRHAIETCYDNKERQDFLYDISYYSNQAGELYASQYKAELSSKEALIGELRAALEGVMRLKDLWLPPDNIELIEDEHKGEYLALGAMHDKILTALNKLK